MSSSVIQLECQCNNYPWGKKGSSSLAAKYAAATPGGHSKLDEPKEYAEQWMGTYPTTPSLVLATGEDLQKHINSNEEKLIGKAILDKFGANLPYLPKILSIAKALPLQIHPDKGLAAKLHKKDPEKFGDANHKPEIAIQQLFTAIPILKSRFTKSSETHFNGETLKEVVGKILSASDEEIVELYESLKKTEVKDFGKHTYIPELLPRLAEQYDKSDQGNLVALLTMNYLVLQKGDAIYVPAELTIDNGIHAYLSGDIVECMARSDNVLNTGFCPRADRDSIELFTAALTFSPKDADEALLKPKKSDKGLKGHTQVLAPPLSEFDMLITKLKGEETETIKALQGPAILIVTGGKGKMRAEGKEHEVKEGYVFFIGYNTEIELAAESGLEAHIAFAEA
ncbi:RmlC-like cupin domain-containing protein [Hyaloscypha sp. PMI_1271]|nr:RmlC-like cupin domain-containing protein [Hyaloscypha sp. PMI_1271]